MLRERSKLMFFYLNNTIKSILGLSHRKDYKIYIGEREYLDPTTIPKYKNQLDKPYVYHPMMVKKRHSNKIGEQKIIKEHLYFIDISEFKQQILPEGFPQTTVWGCGGLVKEPKKASTRYVQSSPGGTFEAMRYVPVHIKWKNRLKVPVKIHLHGGEKPLVSDDTYHIYKNRQEPSTYWYYGQYNEGMGNYNWFGLTGFYLLREDKDELKNNLGLIDLPCDKYEYPVIIQDYSFYTDGSIALPQNASDISEKGFLGDVIVVNGKAWPNLDVERRQYRFYILNGSNIRFYNLKLSNNLSFTLIGGDKGLLPSPVKVDEILLAPGERADVLVDFSRLPIGTKIYMTNNAKAPYPEGDLPDPETTGQIMRFTIPEYETISVAPVKLPEKLYEQLFKFSDLSKEVHIISEETIFDSKILMFDGQVCESPIKIHPYIDLPEEWILINLTSKAYPLHLTDVKFKIINRQKFDTFTYINKGENLDAKSISPYLLGEPIEPQAYESGWKDTVRLDPGAVTRIVIIPSNG